MEALQEDTTCLSPSVLMRSFRKDKIVQMYIETKTELFKERNQSVTRERQQIETLKQVEDKLGMIQKDYDEEIETLRCVIADAKRQLAKSEKSKMILGVLLLLCMGSTLLYFALEAQF